MTSRNIVAISFGLLVGSFPTYATDTYVRFFAVPLGRISPFDSIAPFLSEWFLAFLVGVLLCALSSPKRYYLVPCVALGVSMLSSMNSTFLYASITLNALSALGVFLTFLVFGLLGFYITSVVQKRGSIRSN